MIFRGKIKNGAVILDQPVPLPDGAEVEITPATNGIIAAGSEQPPAQTWAEVFKDIIGSVEGLPSDMAENHDHYIHGGPKK